ncbi:hypothetical protein ES702_05233 [subsurface metagenome]
MNKKLTLLLMLLLGDSAMATCIGKAVLANINEFTHEPLNKTLGELAAGKGSKMFRIKPEWVTGNPMQKASKIFDNLDAKYDATAPFFIKLPYDSNTNLKQLRNLLEGKMVVSLKSDSSFGTYEILNGQVDRVFMGQTEIRGRMFEDVMMNITTAEGVSKTVVLNGKTDLRYRQRLLEPKTRIFEEREALVLSLVSFLEGRGLTTEHISSIRHNMVEYVFKKETFQNHPEKFLETKISARPESTDQRLYVEEWTIRFLTVYKKAGLLKHLANSCKHAHESRSFRDELRIQFDIEMLNVEINKAGISKDRLQEFKDLLYVKLVEADIPRLNIESVNYSFMSGAYQFEVTKKTGSPKVVLISIVSGSRYFQ